MEAIRLSMETPGKVYFVTSLDGHEINHAYLVPEGSCDDAIALNQADNGYPQYPALSAGTVRRNGTLYF